MKWFFFVQPQRTGVKSLVLRQQVQSLCVKSMLRASTGKNSLGLPPIGCRDSALDRDELSLVRLGIKWLSMSWRSTKFHDNFTIWLSCRFHLKFCPDEKEITGNLLSGFYGKVIRTKIRYGLPLPEIEESRKTEIKFDPSTEFRIRWGRLDNQSFVKQR